PVDGSTNETAPLCDPIATVRPSGLIAAADGDGRADVIEIARTRRIECTSNTVRSRPATTIRRLPESISLSAIRAPEPIWVVDNSLPLGSAHRSTYAALGFPASSVTV